MAFRINPEQLREHMRRCIERAVPLALAELSRQLRAESVRVAEAGDTSLAVALRTIANEMRTEAERNR
jgi:hypothetical protein